MKIPPHLLLASTLLAFAEFAEANDPVVCKPQVTNTEYELKGSERYDGRDLWYESQVFKRANGPYRYRYCLKNEHPYTLLYVYWYDDDDEGEIYVQNSVPAQDTYIRRRDFPEPPAKPAVRDFEYGPTKAYGDSADVSTVFQTADLSFRHGAFPQHRFIRTQVSQAFGMDVSLTDILSDPRTLDQYLDYLASLDKSPSLSLFSSEQFSFPKNDVLASKLVAGDAIEATPDMFYKVEFGIGSEISSTDKTATLTLFAMIPRTSIADAIASDTLARITLHAFSQEVDSISIDATNMNSLARTGRYMQTLNLGKIRTDHRIAVAKGIVRFMYDDSVVSEISFDGFVP